MKVVPYEKVVGLSPDVAIAVLLPMLNEPRENEYWPNIVVTLGMLGDDRAVPPLLDFITRRESDAQLTRSQSIAKTSAVMALGYVVNRTGNREALTYMEEGIYPEAWEARNVLWKSSFFPSDAERNDQLAIMSVLGLGISGHPEASSILQTLRQPSVSPRVQFLRKRIPTIDNISEEALKANAIISKDGLKLYYESKR